MRRPFPWVPVVLVAVTIASAWLTVARLRLSSDLSTLFPESGDAAALVRWNGAFGGRDPALVLVRGDVPDDVAAVADAIAAALRHDGVGRARHRRGPGADRATRSDPGLGLRRPEGPRQTRRARDAAGHATATRGDARASPGPRRRRSRTKTGSRETRCASRRCRGSRGPSSRRGRRRRRAACSSRTAGARASSSPSREAARSYRPTLTPSSTASSARRRPRRGPASRRSWPAATRSRWRPRR